MSLLVHAVIDPAGPSARRTLLLRPLGLLLLVLVGAFLAGATSRAAELPRKRDKSHEFFESGIIPSLHIEIAATNMASLRRDPRSYVRASVRDGRKTYEDVGIHVKGAAGSTRSIDDKPALTLNFDKFRDGQKFQGMDKLHLNNSVQDGSYMAEAVCSELFLAAGVPTARTSHARVWLNGRDLGLYVLKEGYDRTFLKRHFKNTRGNLYDGGFLREITEPLQRDAGEGDVENYKDLRAVAAAARERDFSRRMGRLEQVLDVERFLSFVALEILTEHWDGYALKRNNYRVYHDPDSGQCVFIPHGMDQMFWSPNRALLPTDAEGLVARAVLETEEGRMRYRHRVSNIVSNVFTAERLTNHIHQLQARIRPVLAAINEGHAREHDNMVQHLKNQVLQRIKRVNEMLSEPVPEPVAFGADGTAALAKWQSLDLKSTGVVDEQVVDGRKTLHIAAGPGERCTASWRSAVVLKRGVYVFEAKIRTAGVVPIANEPPTRGAGAGIRISQPRAPRTNTLVGDHDWQSVEYEIAVTGQVGEAVLVCELRAAKGEAWFDLASLRLRLKQP